MSKVKNISGGDLTVPWLGGRLVLAGQVVEVPDDDTYAYTQQTSTWEPADAAATAAHDAAAPVAEVLEEAASDPNGEPPAGNASRDVWAAWVLGSGRATEAELEPLGRDEIRDTYSTGTNDGSI